MSYIAHENLVDCFPLWTLAKFDLPLTLYNLGLSGRNGWQRSCLEPGFYDK